MTTSRRSPYFNQVRMYDNGFYNIVDNKGFVSRQQAPIVYDMNASIYAYRPDFLKRAIVVFLDIPAKIYGIGKANLPRNLSGGSVAFDDQVIRFFHPHFDDVFMQAIPRGFFEQGAQVGHVDK